MILLIDNYDSFTYNLVQRIGELYQSRSGLQDPVRPRQGNLGRFGDPHAADSYPMGIDLRVVRNDKITADQAVALKPDHVIISPGPCTPKQGGVSNGIIRALAGKVPLLGVCLGHQCIGETFGMTVGRNDRLMHGKTSPIYHDGKTLFAGLSNPFTATRYHSLVIQKDSFDHQRFEISAWTQQGEVMGLRAKPSFGGHAMLEGVQFHPESFLTTQGPRLLANFLGLDTTPIGVYEADRETSLG